MKKTAIALFLLAVLSGFSQGKKAYQIFDKNGKIVSYEKLLKASEKAEVVLFGEYHNNSVVHWLQLELTKDFKDIVTCKIVDKEKYMMFVLKWS